MKFPMTARVIRALFAAISMDTSLPKRHRGRRTGLLAANVQVNGDPPANNNREADVPDNNVAERQVEPQVEQAIIVDARNPAMNCQTVTAQTYQNYKSAIKWWHAHNDVEGKF